MANPHRRDIATIIVIGLLAFGLQIPWLGYFQDDWNFVYYSSALGSQGLQGLLLVDGRPGAAWLYDTASSLLGYRPAVWQAFSLALRVLTAIVFWMILNRLWPGRRYGNLVAAVFFLAYPFFTLQPLAVTYAQIFMAYLLYALSILFMIQAVLKPEKYLLYTIPAVLFTFLHLFTVEYFVGLELLRPVLLWFLLARRDHTSRRETLKKVLPAWLPYLLTFVFFVAWRSFFLPQMGARHDPLATFYDLGQILLSVARNVVADGVLMLVRSWFNIINPGFFVIGPVRNLYYFAAVLVGAVCFYLLAKGASREDGPSGQLKEVMLAGLLIFATGMLSVYSMGYIINQKIPPWNSRFSLPVMLGLALLVSALIEILITSKRTRHIFLAVLVGFVIGWHNYNTLDFKSAWEKQTRLYEQLAWRAPSIKPGTAIIASEEILGYMGDYPTSFGINTIYDSGGSAQGTVPLWFFALSENFSLSGDPANGQAELETRRGTLSFRGKLQDALYITYEPENRQCLWVLRPEDAEYRYLPEVLKEAVKSASIGNIQPEPAQSSLYPLIVPENKDTWCYYYQKADLARQMEDPQQVLALWQQAQEKGFRPDNGFEYIPFIEAYAQLGDWEQAFQLTRNAYKATKAMYFILCPTWQRLERGTPASPTKAEFVSKAYDQLSCAPE